MTLKTISLEKNCSEIAGENCPCALAESLQCPACGLLNSQNLCDCSERWAGLCIYQIYLDNGGATSK